MLAVTKQPPCLYSINTAAIENLILSFVDNVSVLYCHIVKYLYCEYPMFCAKLGKTGWTSYNSFFFLIQNDCNKSQMLSVEFGITWSIESKNL